MSLDSRQFSAATFTVFTVYRPHTGWTVARTPAPFTEVMWLGIRQSWESERRQSHVTFLKLTKTLKPDTFFLTLPDLIFFSLRT